jgi:tetratricopeptide (TPR) repeat protein
VDQLSPLSYLLSQAGVLVHYLQLCLWPLHQCLDYAWPAANGTMEIVLPLLLVGGLLGATAWALVWRPAWGFLGCVFFVVLAPTSSIVPIHDLAVEHRMYLPSVAVIAAGVLAVYVASERVLRQRPSWSRGLPVARYCLAGGVIAALAALTIARNEVYRSPIQLWQDTATRAPHNARAHCNLGDAFCQAGQLDDGLTHFLQAVALEPHYALAHYNLGTTYYQQARYDEAADHLLEAIELKPDYAAAYNNLGLVFCRRRQSHDGLGYLTQATELEPDNGTYQNALGTALYDLRQYPAAIAHLQRAVEMLPTDVCAHYNLANSLLAGKQFGSAIRHYQQTLELDPKYELAHYVHYGLGNAYEAIGEPEQALSEYQHALALKADHVGARYRLASVLHSAGRLDEAIDQYRQTLAIDPNHAGAERALRLAEASANRPISSTLR